MDRISDEVSKSLVPELRKVNMLLADEAYSAAYENMRKKSRNNNVDYNNEYCLAQISNFNKLIAISNEKGIPIFDIDLDDSAAEGQKKTLKWFKYLYSAFADRIIELTK